MTLPQQAIDQYPVLGELVGKLKDSEEEKQRLLEEIKILELKVRNLSQQAFGQKRDRREKDDPKQATFFGGEAGTEADRHQKSAPERQKQRPQAA